MLEWTRLNWRRLVPVAAVPAVGAGAFGASPLPAFHRGVMIGVFGAALVATLAFVVVVGSGQLRRMWGIGGEVATAEELSTPKRQRQGWQIVHGVQVGAELDHIAIGPGGVLAIESKWLNDDCWRVTERGIVGALGDPLGQVRRYAGLLQRFFRSPRGGRHEIDVIPVLIIWGPGSPSIPGGTCSIDGVQVFSGDDVDAFHSWLDQPRLDKVAFEPLQLAVSQYADQLRPTAA